MDMIVHTVYAHRYLLAVRWLRAKVKRKANGVAGEAVSYGRSREAVFRTSKTAKVPVETGRRPRGSRPGRPSRVGPVQTPASPHVPVSRGSGLSAACHPARSLSLGCPRRVRSRQGCRKRGARSGCLAPSAVSRSSPAPGRATASGRRGRASRK